MNTIVIIEALQQKFIIIKENNLNETEIEQIFLLINNTN